MHERRRRPRSRHKLLPRLRSVPETPGKASRYADVTPVSKRTIFWLAVVIWLVVSPPLSLLLLFILGALRDNNPVELARQA